MAEKMTLEGLTTLVNELVNKMGLLNDRVRLIEERSHQNREKTRIVEENVITKFKDLRDDVKRLNLETDALRKNLTDVTKTIQRMIRDLSKTAKLSDVNVIEKVIEFFDPTRYLTEKDINRIISEREK
jgi:DNA-binding ferritin-like protein (Dps family)